MSNPTTTKVASELKIPRRTLDGWLAAFPELRPAERKGNWMLWSPAEVRRLREFAAARYKALAASKRPPREQA